MMFEFLEKTHRLADPVATTGDRLYMICSQNGLFPDAWSDSHVPHEHWGVWAHPIKLLDGFWLAIRNEATGVTGWLGEADACRVYGYTTEFEYRVGPLRVIRRDFVPEGMMGAAITVTVQTPDGWHDPLTLLAVLRSDLRPAWLGETVGMHDAPDSAETAAQGTRLLLRDTQNPWCLLAGGAGLSQVVELNAETDGGGATPFHSLGQGARARLHLPLEWGAKDTLQSRLILAGSEQGIEAAHTAFGGLANHYDELFQQKKQLYNSLSHTSVLDVPDDKLNAAFHWSKLACQMLARRTEEHGLGAGAGLPGYPWWFGIDTEYSVLPMLQSGLFELVQASLRLLKTVSEAHNPDTPGRVIHELSTTGVIFNAGNLVETPAFTRAVYQTWCWTGDDAFLEEMYAFCKAGVLNYTLGTCDPDGDLCGSGRSIIETLEMHADLECIDIACYTWEALTQLQEMAAAVGDTAVIPELTDKAATLADHIRTVWWLPEEGLFADVRASVNEVKAALAKMDERRQGADWEGIRPQVEMAHQLFDREVAARAAETADADLSWLLRHWVVLCPMEVGLATPEQAARSFARLLSLEFCNEWGMYLHPQRHDVMSINSGLLALALARYGRMDEALALVRPQAAALTVRTPGAISEALPDMWCFLQLWSALGVISPLVEGVLGIRPNAATHTLRVTPYLPRDWDRSAVRRLRIGNYHATVTVQRERTAQHAVYQLTVQNLPESETLELGFYVPEDAQIDAVLLDGEPVAWQWQTDVAGRALVCTTRGSDQLTVKLVE